MPIPQFLASSGTKIDSGDARLRQWGLESGLWKLHELFVCAVKSNFILTLAVALLRFASRNLVTTKDRNTPISVF